VKIHRAYRYRIYPTPEQEARLVAWENALRFLWNLAHEQRLYGLSASVKRYYTAYDQQKELADLRAELPWLADVPRHVCDNLLNELDAAWQRCFKRLARQPHWKRKGRSSVAIGDTHGKSACLDGATVVLPKIGPIRAKIHRDACGAAKGFAVVREGQHWFVALRREIETADPVPSTKPTVAIDRGVVNLFADSDGRLVPNPRPFEKVRARLARAQRVVARRKKGSRNQQKARARVACLHRKARRQREAVLHRESKHYAQNHGAVIVERLDIRSMTASGRGTIEQPGTNVRAKAGLNRAILDSGWGRFVEMLRYKVVPEGARVVEVVPAYSSQTCAACGVIDAHSRRSQSKFECVACGHCANADVNAAKVLLTRGGHGDEGCGGDAVRRPAKQQTRVARRRGRRAKTQSDFPSSP
jgi:putative transposase